MCNTKPCFIFISCITGNNLTRKNNFILFNFILFMCINDACILSLGGCLLARSNIINSSLLFKGYYFDVEKM